MSGANVNMNVKVRRLDGTNIDHDMNLGSADDASQPYDDLEKGYGLFVIRAVTDIDPFWHRSIPDLTQQPVRVLSSTVVAFSNISHSMSKPYSTLLAKEQNFQSRDIIAYTSARRPKLKLDLIGGR